MLTIFQAVDPHDPNWGVQDQKRTMVKVTVGIIVFVTIVATLALLGIRLSI